MIALSILHHCEVTPQERAAYLKRRRALAGDEFAEDDTPALVQNQDNVDDEDVAQDAAAQISQERYIELSAREQIILSISVNGFGKRSSSYEYRLTGRGGKGVVAMVVNERNGKLVASLPIEENDEIMLVTNAGQLIRCPVRDIRVAGRTTQGVIVFKTASDEHVVSVERVSESDAREPDLPEGAEEPPVADI